VTHATKSFWLVLILAASAIPAGCTGPAALERSQSLQLGAMTQYRDEMASYHEKVKAQLEADKRRELDAALAASLAQAADGEGHVDVAAAVEKVRKRLDLEQEFRTNLVRLDSEFRQRQVAIGRAIDLARDTLGLVADYNRLGVLIRSLFVREIDAAEKVQNYETERSPTNAGSTSEPEAGSR
jgi:hypothetical protein